MAPKAGHELMSLIYIYNRVLWCVHMDELMLKTTNENK